MKNTCSSGGINFSTALLLIFITLKLCNVIDWSWWWVMSPLWIPLVLLLTWFLVYFGWLIFCHWCLSAHGRRRGNSASYERKP